MERLVASRLNFQESILKFLLLRKGSHCWSGGVYEIRFFPSSSLEVSEPFVHQDKSPNPFNLKRILNTNIIHQRQDRLPVLRPLTSDA